MKRSLLVSSLVALASMMACGGPAAGTDSDSDSGDLGGAGADGADTGGNGNGDGDGGTGGANTGGSGTGGGENPAGGGMGGNDSSAAVAFCEEYADTVCEWASECGSWTNCEDWGGYLTSTRECDDAVASVEAEFLVFDPEAATACIAAMQAVTCSNGPPFFEATVKTVCPEAFVGTVAIGDECTSADSFGQFDECAEGFCYRPPAEPSGLECLGTCTAFKEDGDLCTEADRCAPGLHCIQGECGPPAGLGDDCMDRPCETGLTCGGATTYTCRQLGSPGSTCVDTYDCTWPGVCTDDECVIDVPEGEVCRDDDTCEEGLYCQASSTSSDALCAIPVASGDTCDPVYDRCEEGYACSVSEPYTCVEEFGAEDEPCGPSGCDVGLWCDATDEPVCRSRGGEGAACPINTDACQEGLICMSDGECHGLGELDEPCAPTFYSNTCTEGLFCDRETGLCKAARSEDGTCNPNLVLESCQEGLYCACLADGCPYYTDTHDPADVCTTQKGNGEMCTTDTECAGGYCLDDECTDSPPSFENCTR